MMSLSDVKQAEIIEAFKSTSRYLDDLLNTGILTQAYGREYMCLNIDFCAVDVY